MVASHDADKDVKEGEEEKKGGEGTPEKRHKKNHGKRNGWGEEKREDCAPAGGLTRAAGHRGKKDNTPLGLTTRKKTKEMRGKERERERGLEEEHARECDRTEKEVGGKVHVVWSAATEKKAEETGRVRAGYRETRLPMQGLETAVGVQRRGRLDAGLCAAASRPPDARTSRWKRRVCVCVSVCARKRACALPGHESRLRAAQDDLSVSGRSVRSVRTSVADGRPGRATLRSGAEGVGEKKGERKGMCACASVWVSALSGSRALRGGCDGRGGGNGGGSLGPGRAAAL